MKEKKIIIKYKFKPAKYATSYNHPPSHTILAYTPYKKRVNSTEVNFVLITTLYTLYSRHYYNVS
ncbi:unknown [Bacteroides intestinalis CAG:315]|jgi:pyruvate/oxaloacetate carboxyltransferase|nr:unknown [Bacteroides intestinalis CAG:315]